MTRERRDCLRRVYAAGWLIGLSLLAAPSARAGPSAARTAADDFVAARPAAPGEGALAAGLGSIRAAALGAHVRFLAAPALEGRGLGRSGLDAALEYAAAQLALAGVEPFGSDGGGEAGAGGDWFQPVPIRRLAELGGEVEVTRGDGAGSARRRFAAGADCRFAPRPAQSVSGPVVFAGLGVRAPEAGRDDYRGLDVRGKIVLVAGGLPAASGWEPDGELAARWWPEDPEERWDARLEAAAELGAAALLAIEPDVARLSARPDPEKVAGFFRPFAEPPAAAPPLVEVSPALAAVLLGGPAPAAPRELAGVLATVRVEAEERPLLSRNVLGIVRGADPALRGEAIVVGAHVDHLGVVAGEIRPGADDNASGAAALIEIARAFAVARERPRRSVVFAFWTGEEEGKLGSGYYVENPRWPLARTAAYLNLDMVGYPWLVDDVRKLVEESGLPDGAAFLAGLDLRDFVGPGLPPGAPALEAALRAGAAATGLALYLDFTDGVSGGSDYRDFARAGVPFVRFVDNYGPWYHTGGDTPERLDTGIVERMARLAFATAWTLAGGE